MMSIWNLFWIIPLFASFGFMLSSILGISSNEHIRHSKWEIVTYKGDLAKYAKCKCGYQYNASYVIAEPGNVRTVLGALHNYCPNCGRKMVLEVK